MFKWRIFWTRITVLKICMYVVVSAEYRNSEAKMYLRKLFSELNKQTNATAMDILVLRRLKQTAEQMLADNKKQ